MASDDITADLNFILTNAVYFKGKWKEPFNKEATADREFYLEDGEQVQVETMKMEPEAGLNYTMTDNFHLLELPYKGKEISMVIYVPTEGFSPNISSLDNKNMREYKQEMSPRQFDEVYLPKLDMKKDYMLADDLQTLGLKNPFDINISNFTKMNSEYGEEINLSFVKHKATLQVDEEGTTATAASSVGGSGMTDSINTKSIFRVDRPFILSIEKSDTILFIGKIEDPRSI